MSNFETEKKPPTIKGDFHKPAYTLKRLAALRRRAGHRLPFAKAGEQENGLIKTLAGIDHAIEVRKNLKPVRSCLPKKKQREMGLLEKIEKAEI